VLVGLVGVVGVGMWEEPGSITGHVMVLQNLTYLLIEATNKVRVGVVWLPWCC